LRRAILDAEVDAAHDTINFAPGVSGTIVLTDTLPLIDYDLTINGLGADELAVSGDNSYRVFEIDSDAAVTITGLTIRDGRVNGTDEHGGGLYVDGGASVMLSGTHVVSNSVTGSDENGGGLYVADGYVTLQDTAVVSNSVTGRGGGVYVYTDTATLEITGGRIASNSGPRSGGGVYVLSGSATLTGTEVANNSASAPASGKGGGVCVSHGSVRLSGAAVISNSAGEHGGGLYAHRGMALLSQTRVERNRATSDGGGVNVRRASASAALTATCVVSNSAGNNGGGVNAHNGVMTLSDTCIERNSAGDIGGGLYVNSGSATLTGTQVVSNSATNGGGLVIGSLGGGITATNGCIVFNSDMAVRDIGGGTLEAGDNWWGMPDGPSGQGSGRGDSVGTNVTFTPYKSSPPPGCLSYMDVVITKDVTPTTGVAKGGPVSYTLTLRNSSPLSDTNVFLTDTLPGELNFDSWVISPTGTMLDPVADEITWSGTVTNGEVLTWRFRAVHVGEYSDVVTNTGEFSGTVRAGEADAVFSVVGPDITVYPASLTFGSRDVTAGPSPTQTVMITNEGDADLRFTPPITITGADAGAFVIAGDSGEDPLQPGGTRTVEVAFGPASAGAKSAALTIQSDDPDEATVKVDLSGTGTMVSEPGYSSDPAPGSTFDMGTAPVDGTVSATLTVSETGNATLVVTPALSGPDAAYFGVSPSTLTIADGGVVQDLTIACTPSVQRTLAATLTVAHNADGSPALYPLSCTGEAYRIHLPLVVRGS
jgi:uncharacterized repeat protein (TIGR01451 family)